MKDPFSLYRHPAYAAVHTAPTIDFPLMLIMQASSYCNFTCKQCPRVIKVPRRTLTGMTEGYLSPETVRVAAEQFKARPDFIGVLFALYGEPLMNPEIDLLVGEVKKAGKRVQITTNGLLLTDRMIRRLCDAGLDKIKFSFQGTTRREYTFWRNNPHYDKVLAHIHDLLEYRERKNIDLFVQVGTSVANDTDEEIAAFMRYWGERVDDVYFDATGMLHIQDQDYVRGKAFRHQAIRRTAPCFDIFTRMSILHDGRVPLCVDDEEHDMGNVRRQSISEIWNGIGFAANRKTILEQGNVLPPCRYCYTSPRPEKD